MADKLLGKFKKSPLSISPGAGYIKENLGIPPSAFPFIQNTNVINLPGTNPIPNQIGPNNAILTEIGSYILTETSIYIVKEQ
jgi:hypothetical protein